MASTLTSNAGLAKPASLDRAWGVTLNANADILDGMTALGGLCVTTNETPSTSLTVKVSAGSFVNSLGAVTTYAGGTITLSASTTSAVWLTDSGTLTTGSAFPATMYVPLASAVAGASTITSVADKRVQSQTVNVSGGLGPVASKTAAYTATGLEGSIRCDTTSGSIAITLPTAAGTPVNKPLVIVRSAGSNSVTFTAGGGTRTLGAVGSSGTVIFNGTSWDMIGSWGTVT